MPIPTPHIEVEKCEDFAKTVIMPGDPIRVKYIAKKFLKRKRCINKVRGILAYTGFYNGKKITVMASGMGCPSIGIYSYELFNFYNVDNIIRIGSCGTYSKDLNLGDIILSEKVVTNTNYCNMFQNNILEVKGSKKLIDLAKQKAKENNRIIFYGNTFCTDTFYGDKNEKEVIQKNNCLATEMESAALYYNANKSRKNALTICTVSDHLLNKQRLTIKEREKNFDNMILFALSLI